VDPVAAVLVVQAFDGDGNPIAGRQGDGQIRKMPEKLKLAPW
jgi:alkaline phosphatase D